jgi:phosphatidylserine/phosphatidylglycerophosphate/cardiolipin synthase-like enzyme
MIVDRNTVITGSFNFTKAAEEKNAENLQVIRSEDVAKLYLKNFDWHLAHSNRYQQ